MKKVININFQGRVIPIEENAYDILKKYIDSLTKFFANEDGKEEIINDIEGRIGELFAETLKKGNSCISDEDINRIIDSMGRPEDFEAEEINVQSQLGGNSNNNYQEQKSTYSESYTYYSNSNEPKKLYRDENSKILGGVCSGLANYFGLDPLVVRIIALILLFSFGIGFLPYIIIWVAVPSSATQVIGSRRKRLFRDGDDKIIAGVASGLGHYFGINAWIPRALFLIPFFSFVFKWGHWGMFDYPNFLKFSFSPGTLMAYIILWLVLPEAKSSADKLEMKGEKVDFNSIKDTIQSDLKSFGKKAETWGNEISKKAENLSQEVSQKAAEVNENFKQTSQQWTYTAKENAATYSAQAMQNSRKASKGIGYVITLLFKIFAYFVIGCVVFAIVAMLFSFGVLSTGLLPLKAYLLKEGVQDAMAWGTLIFFIWVPIIGIITFIIRRITKSKSNSNVIRWGFAALWTLGWICFFSFITLIAKDFRFKNNVQEEIITLSNPLVNKLEVSTAPLNQYYGNSIFNFESFATIDEDSAYVRNIWVRIVKSPNDSFHVKLARKAQGSSRAEATDLANKINFEIQQKDTLLTLSKGVNINTKDKFRNQHVIVTIAVPVGKRFIVSHKANFGRYHGDRVHIGFDDRDWDWDYSSSEDGAYVYDSDTEYMMTATNGIVKTNVKLKNGKYSYDSNEEESNEALENFKQSKEELQREIEKKKQKMKADSLELEEKQRELNKTIDTTPRYKYKAEIPSYDASKKAVAQENKYSPSNGFFDSENYLNRLVI
jgi:phage shock protein PspC (stress-responsive transcriptional regulator)